MLPGSDRGPAHPHNLGYRSMAPITQINVAELLNPSYYETTHPDRSANSVEEDKPKAAPAEKPKAKEPKPEEEDDLVPQEPMAKQPLEPLPKSAFNLDDWKRAYSNKKIIGAGGSIEWFYEQ